MELIPLFPTIEDSGNFVFNVGFKLYRWGWWLFTVGDFVGGVRFKKVDMKDRMKRLKRLRELEAECMRRHLVCDFEGSKTLVIKLFGWTFRFHIAGIEPDEVSDAEVWSGGAEFSGSGGILVDCYPNLILKVLV